MITTAAVIEVLGSGDALPPNSGLDCALLRLAQMVSRRCSSPSDGDIARTAAREAILEAAADIAAAGTGDAEDFAILDAISHSLHPPFDSSFDSSIDGAALPLTAWPHARGTSDDPDRARVAETIAAANVVATVAELWSPHSLVALLAALDRRVFALAIMMLNVDRNPSGAPIAAIAAAVRKGRIAPAEALALAIITFARSSIWAPGSRASMISQVAQAIVDANMGAESISHALFARPCARSELSLPSIII
jgi:hypothetical protein